MSWVEQYASRVMTAEEAVKDIASGQRVFLTGNCSVPQQLLDALVARAPALTDVEIVNGPDDRQGAARRPGDARPPQDQHALHQRQRPRGRPRGPGRFHAGPAVRSPAALPQRRPAAGRGPDPRQPARRARLLQPGDRGRADQDAGPGGPRGHRRGQRAHAAHAGRLLHPHHQDRPRRPGRLPAGRAADGRSHRPQPAASASTSPL